MFSKAVELLSDTMLRANVSVLTPYLLEEVVGHDGS